MEIVICGTKRGQHCSALWCVSGFWVFPPCLHPGPSHTLPTAAWGKEERSLGEGDGKEVRLLIRERFTERKVTQPHSSSLLSPPTSLYDTPSLSFYLVAVEINDSSISWVPGVPLHSSRKLFPLFPTLITFTSNRCGGQFLNLPRYSLYCHVITPKLPPPPPPVCRQCLLANDWGSHTKWS